MGVRLSPRPPDMKKTKKGFIAPVLVAVIALLVIGGGVYIYKNKKVEAPDVVDAGKCGLTVTSISPNTQVSFPLTLSGTIDNSNSKKLGCTWQMFEGQAGSAHLYFNYNNDGWKPIGASVPIKVSNWTSTKTSFVATLNFYNGGIGIPNGTPIKITFTEENASGLPPVDTFDFPVILK